MNYFAKLNDHEQKMLNIWLEFWAQGYDGDLDDLPEEYGFEDWLRDEISFYDSADMAEYAEPYRQCLAEWRA